MTSEVIIRRATEADAIAYYGARPPLSLRGYVAELDGEIVGIGGLSYEGGNAVAFSETKPALRERREDMKRGLKVLMAMVKSCRTPVYAVADPDEPGAAELLARLGWTPTGRTCPIGDVLIRGA